MPTPPRPAPARPAHPLPDPAELVLQARAAAQDGDHEGAARAFRQAAYLDPDQPAAHAGLSAALRAMGDARAAARAAAAGRAAARRAAARDTR
jgi:thioredoxin-like negative regulator of GroEL